MMAIPRGMLIHSMDVYREEKSSDWSGKRLTLLGGLYHVRVEPSSRVVRDKNNKEIQLAATLFFDCKNSRNTANELQEDLIADFGGDKYRIVSVEPLYDRRRLHHYELGMVRYAGKG